MVAPTYTHPSKTPLELAQTIRDRLKGCWMLGVPLPSGVPESFLGTFDAVAVGEGENRMAELAQYWAQRQKWAGVKGLVYKEGNRIVHAEARPF